MHVRRGPEADGDDEEKEKRKVVVETGKKQGELY